MEHRREYKPSYDTNRQRLGEIYPLDTPFNLIIDGSEACNFRCNYCFRSDSDKKNWSYAATLKNMEMELFKEVFEQTKQFPTEIRQISLSGHGEPLCNPHIPEMVRYMRESGYSGKISIHTNASLLDADYAVELGSAGLSRIVISLQGMSGEKYERICGTRLDFDRFVRNIELLFNSSRDAEVITQIDIKIADVALDDNEDEMFYNTFEHISDKLFIENVVPIWKNVKIQEGVENQGINKFGDRFEEQYCCPLVFHTLLVTPEGDIYPCTQLINDHCLGNVLNTSLSECWNSEQRKKLLTDILMLNRPDMCEGCYILQNSIYTEEDMIDGYRTDILSRMDIGRKCL